MFNSEEMLELLDQYPNVVLWLNGHKHSGGYTKVGNRHHLTLKGMQEEDEHWYQLDFSKERIVVYQAEDLEKPAYDMAIDHTLFHSD